MTWIYVRRANDLNALLEEWLLEDTDEELVEAIDGLFAHTLATSNDAQLNGLDITAYVTALGLPDLLQSASFSHFVARTAYDTELARRKLRCAGNLLGAYLVR